MKHAQGQSGMTLIEMLAAILVLTLLICAMGTGMEAAMGIYQESVFQSESAAMADILNTAMEDVLGFSHMTQTGDGWLASNGAYGLQAGGIVEKAGYLYLADGDRESLLVNRGVYGNLAVADFCCTYEKEEGADPGWFRICYTITDGTRTRSVETAIRLLNGV